MNYSQPEDEAVESEESTEVESPAEAQQFSWGHQIMSSDPR